LAPPIKAAIESLVGRSLEDDEQVSVRAFRPHEAPKGQAHGRAVRRLEEHLDLMAGRVKDVSQDETEAAIEEALRQVRPEPL
jgi:hypothetical protein